MGISCSCPLSTYNDLENGLESVIVNSVNFGNDEEKTLTRSVSFKGRDPELAISRSIGSAKMLLEVSVSFRTRESCLLDIHAEGPSGSIEGTEVVNQSCGSDCTSDRLADSSVLVEQSWRNLLDLVELNYNSVSFFDLLKKESAVSRWSRAGKRAAKVGKGLSKNEKGQKLVLEHWLEAIDVQHRYGHNLRLYFIEWFHSSTIEPFFYWLDRGEGKNHLAEKCPRLKLEQQCIKYLYPMERKAYEVTVENGVLFYKQSREIVDTTGEPKGVKWIFVLSTSKEFFIGPKRKGVFHHSSFLAGGATSAAGRIAVGEGIIKVVSPHSGHYRPTKENFNDFLSYLTENNVNIAEIKKSFDEEEALGPKGGIFLRNDSFDNFPDDILVIQDADHDISTVERVATASAELYSSTPSQSSTNIQTRSKDDLLDRILCRDQTNESKNCSFMLESMQHGLKQYKNSFLRNRITNTENNLPVEELKFLY